MVSTIICSQIKERVDMEELKQLLLQVSDSYSDFVYGIMGIARDFPEWLDDIKQFIKDNPEATTSDIGMWTMTEIRGIDPDDPPKLILTDDDE